MARVKQLDGVKAGLPILVALTHRAPFPDLRAAAAEALGHFHEGETEEILVRVLKDYKFWHVRNAALRALARVATPRAIKALREATRDKVYGVESDQ